MRHFLLNYPFSDPPPFRMRDHGGGVTLLMLVTSVLIIISAMLPQADNAVVFGRYSERL